MQVPVRLLLVAVVVGSACTSTTVPAAGPPSVDAAPPSIPAEATMPLPPPTPSTPSTTTTSGTDGNRLVDGVLPRTSSPVLLPTDVAASHLLTAPAEGGQLLVAVGATATGAWLVADDGDVVVIDAGGLADGSDLPGRPALLVEDGGWVLDRGSAGGGDGRWLVGGHELVADGTGRLTVDGTTVLDDLLPDARFAVRDGLLAVLVAPTSRYGHAVLGDGTEAGGVAVVALATGELVTRWDVPGTEVIEGLGATWADLGAGPEVLVTVSRDEDGARQVALALDGTVRSGPAIGRGNRWRHLLGVDGTRIAEIVTPHLARTWQVLTPTTDALVVTTSVEGTLASHDIGSRDLDRAVLVRLAPGEPAGAIGPSHDDGAVLRVLGPDGERVLDVDLGGAPTTNVAAWTTGAAAVVAVGTPGGIVLLGVG